mmetsp:Transcript_124451/g.278179  ORF Transcript_124451/g.278179 Transcript_124451/m.278179 type:complete len:414 (+) Transcript_124451:70-1311(+)
MSDASPAGGSSLEGTAAGAGGTDGSRRAVPQPLKPIDPRDDPSSAPTSAGSAGEGSLEDTLNSTASKEFSFGKTKQLELPPEVPQVAPVSPTSEGAGKRRHREASAGSPLDAAGLPMSPTLSRRSGHHDDDASEASQEFTFGTTAPIQLPDFSQGPPDGASGSSLRHAGASPAPSSPPQVAEARRGSPGLTPEQRAAHEGRRASDRAAREASPNSLTLPTDMRRMDEHAQTRSLPPVMEGRPTPTPPSTPPPSLSPIQTWAPEQAAMMHAHVSPAQAQLCQMQPGVSYYQPQQQVPTCVWPLPGAMQTHQAQLQQNLGAEYDAAVMHEMHRRASLCSQGSHHGSQGSHPSQLDPEGHAGQGHYAQPRDPVVAKLGEVWDEVYSPQCFRYMLPAVCIALLLIIAVMAVVLLMGT